MMSTLPSVTIHVFPAAQAAAQSSAAWQSLPDRSDPRILDGFIARYPNSKEAYLAFSLRHQLLKAAPTVQAYDDFIARYRDRAGAEQALYELFELIQLAWIPMLTY